MSAKKLENYSDDELLARRKIFTAIFFILFFIIVAYGSYMFYSMFKGTWESTNLLMSVPFLIFIVLLPIRSVQGKILTELRKRGKL